jgi:tetratricopeptide (TPR) repeat protein
MLFRRQIPYLASAVFLTITCNVFAKPIKCFVPSKPWAVTIDLNDFEPWDFLGPKTILGGAANDGVAITVLVEKTDMGIEPRKIREIYGQMDAQKFGRKETIEEIDANNIAILAFNWTTPQMPEVNDLDSNFVKAATKDRWSFHGYAVKDDIAFDIHISCLLTKHSKKEIVDIIRSFQVASSTEQQEYDKLYKDIERNVSDYEKVARVRHFVEKYPSNPFGMLLLAEQYLHSKQLKLAKDTYLKALENNNTQPFGSPVTLWLCYDGLGMACGMAGEYPMAQKYLELGYKLASEMKEPQRLSLSAYNFACLYAETNKIDECLKYLAEAIKLNPEYKKEVKEDSSFSKIKEDVRFKNLAGN